MKIIETKGIFSIFFVDESIIFLSIIFLSVKRYFSLAAPLNMYQSILREYRGHRRDIC